MATIARDLPTGDRPFQVAPPDFEYPFLKNGDSVSFILTRYWKQTIAGYNADRLAARYVPGIDADHEYPEARMIGETKPARTRTGLCEFTRSYARIPTQQTVPSFMDMVLPAPPVEPQLLTNLYLGTTVIVLGNAYYYGGRFFGNGQVFGPLKQPSAQATSGSDAHLTITGHGFNASKPLVIAATANIGNGGNLGLHNPGTTYTNEWSVVDANTISLKGASGTTWTGCFVAGWQRDYKVGAATTVRINRVTDYYLPGVTPGIATAADIPLPTLEGDDKTFIEAVISGSTSINYAVGALEQWRESPILARTLTTLNPSSL